MTKQVPDNETVFIKPVGNEDFEPVEKANINRGLMFGDGIFETMVFVGGHFRFKDHHLSRAQMGADLLRLEIDVKDELRKFEAYLQRQEKYSSPLRIRWNIFRNGLGKYTPSLNDTRQIWMVEAFIFQSPQTKEAFIHEGIFIPNLPWSNCKTLNALPYVQAAIDRQQKGLDEVILLNMDRKVCEAGAANLFWKKNDIYHTPSLESKCIAGVGRSAVLEAFKSRGIEYRLKEFEVMELLQADQVFTTNVTGIHYLKKINSTEFTVTPVEFIENIFKC